MNNQTIGAKWTGAPVTVPTQAKVKYCLYARKSTESEEQQVLSIDSQIKEMARIAERDGLEIVEVRKESHSAKAVGQRDVFNELVKDIRGGKFNGILTWAPNNPSEKFMLMILCSTAKLENDNKSENVKRVLRTRCEQGLRPSMAPTGYLNEKRKDKPCEVIVDPVRAPIVKQMFEKVANEQWSGRRIYHWLRRDVKFKTPTGKSLSLSNIYTLLKKTFYYGPFEYPRGSGNWYTGLQPRLSRRSYMIAPKNSLSAPRLIKRMTRSLPSRNLYPAASADRA